MAVLHGISRRELFRRGAIGLAGVSLLAACAPQSPAAKPTEAPKPAAKPVPQAEGPKPVLPAETPKPVVKCRSASVSV